MGVNIDLKADATQAMTNTSENLPKGIGRVWNLLCGKKEAEVGRQKALLAAQTQKEYELILSDKADLIGGELIAKDDNPNFAAQVLSVEQEQEMKNLAGNVATALEVLQQTQDEEISDEEVNPDFFARWRREAKVIGTPELQGIWGRILAEEVKKPDTISLRALDVLKNLTKEEAETFCNIGQYVVDNRYILRGYIDGKFCEIGEAIKTLLVLEECGLVSSVSSSFEAYPLTEGGWLVFNEYVLKSKNPKVLFATTIIPLSPVGIALYGIADIPKFSEEDFHVLASLFHKKGVQQETVEIVIHSYKNGEVSPSPIYP